MQERVLQIGGLSTTVIGDAATAELVIVLLHGFAMEPTDLAPFAHSLGVPGLFLFPRAPLAASLEPGIPQGRTWWPTDPVARTRALAAGPRDFLAEHPAGLVEARATLTRFLDAVAAVEPAARSLPLIVGGFSQGGMLACDTTLRAPRALAGLALLSSSRIAFNEWQAELERRPDALRALPVFASHGRADSDLAFDAGIGLRDCLAAAGAAVTWVPFDEGHGVPLVVWRRLRQFLLSVGGKPPSQRSIAKSTRKPDPGGIIPVPALIKIQMLGRLQHRDLVLRSVAAACKLVNARTDSAWNEFRTEVVTAVGEAFNNVVLHSYEGREGIVEIDIQTQPDRICIELRDWGDSFDPDAVPLPDFDSLPESGLGIFIIKTLMEIQYTPGRPNVLTLSKSLASSTEQQNNADGEA